MWLCHVGLIRLWWTQVNALLMCIYGGRWVHYVESTTIITVTISLERPHGISICSIFPLCRNPRTVMLPWDSFPVLLHWSNGLSESVKWFLWKPFWFILKDFFQFWVRYDCEAGHYKLYLPNFKGYFVEACSFSAFKFFLYYVKFFLWKLF